MHALAGVCVCVYLRSRMRGAYLRGSDRVRAHGCALEGKGSHACRCACGHAFVRVRTYS